ncbi:MAG TPA: phosphate ABC transporter permease PstA [Candidatus Saccharimonadales bacterium]|nr:phosphate ABC transporter permease PstA [Candidatus Saccharimonadales bacterium]
MNAKPFKWRNFKSSAVSVLCFLCAIMVITPLALVLIHIIRLGASSVDWNFLTHLPKPVGETGGGMANAIVGSFILVGLAVLIGVPIGVLGGVYLSEYGSDRMNWSVRFAADILNGTPSIVWGIVVYALVVVPMKSFSAWAGGLALGFMMIPMVIRTTEEMLALVPGGLREGALALGIPKWKSIVFIVLKTGGKGIITGVLLACARVAGETAPLLFTAFGNRFWSFNLSEPISALPRQIYDYAIAPYDDWHRQAWAGALVLILIALAINIGVRILTRGSSPPASR